MKKLFITFIILIFVFMIGCAQTKNDVIPKSFFVESENYYEYQPGFECSALASAYVLRHFKEDADGLALFESFPGKLASGLGVMPNGITKFFTERGFTARFLQNGTIEDIKREVNKGVPVIVFIHVQEPYQSPHNTHYVPIIGYDEDYFYFAESLKEYANIKDEENALYNRKTDFDKFLKLWSSINDYYENPYFVVEKSL